MLNKRELKVGNVVTLNSEWLDNQNPIKMTIRQVGFGSDGFIRVQCAWFNTSGELQTAVLFHNELTAI